MKHFVLTPLLVAVLAGCDATTRSPTPRPLPTDSAGAPQVDRDNTAVNVRDRDDDPKTPIDQNENQRDVSITADIRKQVVDKNMSVNANNVKIITQDGRVTLRGPVKTDDEKRQIETIAVEVAGVGNVDNQLEVETTP